MIQSLFLQQLGMVGLAIIAGALLNLMPCVLPAIPIKIRSIVNEAGGRPQQRFFAAAAFLVGTLLFFLPLAGLTIALQWSWGTLFQSQALLWVLIAVLLLFAYTTYRDVSLPVPSVAYQMRGSRYVEPFLSGFFCALLATPCVGPFLGGVLAFSLTQPPMFSWIVFAAIGLGLSLPYIILLAFPALLNRLPRPGAWMVCLRQALAFVLLAAAVFFAQTLVPDWAAQSLWALWLAALVLWGGIAFLRANQRKTQLVSALSIVAGVAFLYAGGFLFPQQQPELVWQPLTAQSWQQAQQSNQPVLVEYTADWCINCKVLEKTVFAEDEVAQAVKASNMHTLQGDLTHSDTQLEQILTDLGGAGLPFAAVLNAEGEVVAQFSGMFSKKTLLKALQKATKS